MTVGCSFSTDFAAFAGLPPPKLRDLVEVVGVDVQAVWRDIGLGLGLCHAALEAIETNCRGQTKSCITEVFTKWCEGNTSEYSWKNLAEVLCRRTIKKPGLLSDMFDKIKRL